MIKEELRKIYSKKRLDLSAKEKDKLDDLLLIQFQKLSFFNVQTVLSFWPMEERGEMNTHLFTKYLAHLIPGVQICYPVIDTASNYMDAILVDDETDFEENKYGITEPVNGTKVDPKEIDMIIMPLFAFDKKGFRVGYGKGYYDRFMTLCREDAITVGVSYFDYIDKVDDTHDYDVPLNYCVTPENLYEF